MREGQKHNVTYLKDTRRNLRNNLTAAEATLWSLIKNSQLKGRKFRRQHSIENYVVDFYCPPEKLIIEVDGSVHYNLGVANADYDRDLKLESLGFKVLRTENDLIYRHSDIALGMITKCFKQ
ncbi:MAG: hypothetical protein JWQ25_3102 [Daejeonella sp.]|nr:hypothetical protein [Daejeonella sp.]